MEHLVIVGGGLAAAKAVERLRDEGYGGAVTLVAAERHLPYERPPLSKDLLIEDERPDSTVLAADWWDEHDVRLRTGTAATAIDRQQARVGLDTGEWLSYDTLVLATGAEPKVPDLPGADEAWYLRTIEDADRLLAGLTPGARIAVVGAGGIGLEVAAAARSRDVEVTVLELADLPLEKALGATIAKHLAALHLAHGVDLRTGVSVEEIVLGDDGPVGVRTADGVVEADHVVVAVGAAPVAGLADDAGLEVDNGIVVDERFQTADPRILAVGDVANAWNPTLGQRLRVEHWDNAIRQGRAVADVILGRDTVYDWQPYFYTDQYDLSMEYVGHAARGAEVVVRGDLATGAFIAFWLEEGRVSAAMNVNTPNANPTLRRIIGQTVDPARLTDPAVDLRALV